MNFKLLKQTRWFSSGYIRSCCHNFNTVCVSLETNTHLEHSCFGDDEMLTVITINIDQYETMAQLQSTEY